MSQYGPPGGQHPGQSPEPWPGQPVDEPYEKPSDPWGDQDPWSGSAPTSNPPGSPPPPGYPPSSGQPGGYPPTSAQPGGYGNAAGAGGYGDTARYGTGGGYGNTSGYGGAGGYGNTSGYGGPGGGYPGAAGGHGGGYRDGDPTGHPATRPFEPGQSAVGAGQGWSAPGAGPTWSTGVPQPAGKGGNRGPIIILVVALAVLVFGGGATAVYLLGQDKPDGSGTAAPGASGPAVTPSADPETSEPEPSESTEPQPRSSSDARFVKAGQCVKNEGTRGEPKLVITSCAPKTWTVLKRFDGATSGESDARTKCSKVEGYTDWYFFDSPLDPLDYVLCLKSND